jgi:hypothetical protein
MKQQVCHTDLWFSRVNSGLERSIGRAWPRGRRIERQPWEQVMPLSAWQLQTQIPVRLAGCTIAASNTARTSVSICACSSSHRAPDAALAGATLWRWTLAGSPPGALTGAAKIHLVTSGAIIATTGPYSNPVCGNGTVLALRKSDRAVLWQVTKPWALTTAAVSGKRLFMLYQCGDLVALHLDNGTTIWAKSWSSREPRKGQSTSLAIQVGALLQCSL